ncbi:hypothetical protein [Gordonia sp. CPCC 205333]|uniref:hypothetical protein n=1 Tax=Gordonia sp. CPCC 205333 TaxID=3140790 RepID=UPI003AF37D85
MIDSHSRDRTVNSLRFHCTSKQIVDLYKNASLGTPPTVGKHRLYLLPVSERNGRLGDYRDAKQFGDLQSNLGDALTFGVGPQGQPWVYKNYITGLDAGGPLVYAPKSFVDHKPAWSADFVRDFAGLPVSTHEYRQLTPTVWIGRDFLGPGSVTSPPRQGSAIAIA